MDPELSSNIFRVFEQCFGGVSSRVQALAIFFYVVGLCYGGPVCVDSWFGGVRSEK